MHRTTFRALTLSIALTSMVATAHATVFPSYGFAQGDAGEEYRCPPGYLLAGFKGRTGALIDKVGLICEAIQGPNYKAGNRKDLPGRGGEGGAPTEHYCPPGSAIRDIKVSLGEDSYKQVGAIRFSCSRPADGAATGGATFGNRRLPSGGYSEVQACPGNEYATGLNIRYGKHLNAAGLICGQVPNAQIVLVPPSATQKPAAVQPVEGRGMEMNIDRPGLDFDKFHINDERPDRCQSECARQSDRCKAWTYVRPGLQHKYAVCYLKSAVPPPTPGDCCISGVQKKVVGLGRK
jgi:PAN domain